AVFTWAVVAYILVTEKVPAANALYTIYAVIALDAFMCIIWLSAWALNAARRAMTWQTLGGLLAGVAALGAVVWVLFIVTLVWTIMNFLKGRKDGRYTLGSSSTVTAGHNMEEQKVQGQQPPQPQPQQPQQYVQPEYNGQQQQVYPQYPQQPVEAQTQYQAPQVDTQYQQPQQQHPHDPNQMTPQQQQQQQHHQ
ncbi:hypothetical protein G3M48_002123, partial [Beauveria asiatica]